MYKLISLTTRKEGLTHEEFRDYYENHHVKLGYEFLQPHCVKYARHYLNPVIAATKKDHPPGPAYDCMVEFWFENEAGYRAFEAKVSNAKDTAYIVEDELKFVDRAKSYRYLIVDEQISWEPPHAIP